jgi:hypothetical protein
MSLSTGFSPKPSEMILSLRRNVPALAVCDHSYPSCCLGCRLPAIMQLYAVVATEATVLRWLRHRCERNDQSLVKGSRHPRTLIRLRSCAASWGNRTRGVLAFAICLTLVSYATKVEAYACNNRHYVNSSDHVVHSPSCGREHLHREAICVDGSVSFSEHRRGTRSRHHGVAHGE